jgi:prepilin-type N-terminal cleavage/methylation domain-containing protein
MKKTVQNCKFLSLRGVIYEAICNFLLRPEIATSRKAGTRDGKIIFYKFQIKLSGFTLIEILVSFAILLIIITIGYGFISKGFQSITFNKEQEEAVVIARKAVDLISKEIRGANSSERGDYTLALARNQEIIFYSDIDNDQQTERVRYYKDGTRIIKTITEPGPLLDYSSLPATSTIAQYVNNEDEELFVYHDSNNAETSEINAIRLVNIRLKINVTPWRAPMDYFLITDVSFRNLKSNL